MNKTIVTIFFFIFFICGVLAIIFISRPGIGITPDSVVYLAVARNLLNGLGLNVLYSNGELIPLVHFPPLYSMLLAITGFFSVDPIYGAKFLNSILFGLNICLPGLLIYRYTNSFLLSIGGMLFALGSIPMLYIHAMMWTEGLFIFFGISGLYLLALYLDNRNTYLFIISSILISLSFLTRYAAITWIITGCLGIIFLNKKDYYKKILDLLVFVSITSFPIVICMIKNFYFSGTATNRELCFHPITILHIKDLFYTFSNWLLPLNSTLMLRKIVFFIFIIGIVILLFSIISGKLRGVKYNWTKFHSMACLFLLVYITFLFLSISFFDALTSLDDRILSPLYPLLIILLFHVLYNTISNSQICSIKIIISSVVIILLITHIILSGKWIFVASDEGLGYMNKKWKESFLISKTKVLLDKKPVYSNIPEAIYLFTGNFPIILPYKQNPFTKQENKYYLDEITKMKLLLKEQNGCIVFFNNIERKHLPSLNELKTLVPLNSIFTSEEGDILKIGSVNLSVSG